MERLLLKPKEERRLLRGHFWVYRNELAEAPGLADGAGVDVYASDGRRLVGRGFYQGQGGIAVRILDRHQCALDEGFFAERLARAREYRERIYPGENVYRWVFGESDGLPGLVVDRYGAAVVAETACGFYAQHAEALMDAFRQTPGVTGGWFSFGGRKQAFGEVTSAFEVEVDGLRFSLDIESGQKTGLFLDQRLNIRAMERYVRGARVLDGHCYVGAWSCRAAKAGAASVLGVDTSGPAIERARANAALNGVGDVATFECADVHAVLGRGDRYDVVILDPPALAKTRAHAAKALGLYQSLNRAAMACVEPGGYLITSSCSHFVDSEMFLETLKRAAVSAQRQVWVVDVAGAAPDHPVLMSMPETAYLKCVVLRVM